MAGHMEDETMVTLYVGGNKIGAVPDSEALVRQLVAQHAPVEFRDEKGQRLGTFTPEKEPICPWEPGLTQEELDRRAAEPGGKSLADILKRLGAE
jgi:hypothetical protein